MYRDILPMNVCYYTWLPLLVQTRCWVEFFFVYLHSELLPCHNHSHQPSDVEGCCHHNHMSSVCCHCLLHLFLSYWILIYFKTMLLHITSPACLQMQCGVDFVCFICPWDSCHVSHQSHDDKGPPLPIPHTTTNGTDQKDNTMRKAAGQVKLSMYFIYLLYTILRLVYN